MCILRCQHYLSSSIFVVLLCILSFSEVISYPCAPDGICSWSKAEMTTEKTEYTPVVVGASQPPLPGQPAFPVAFGTNVPGPSTLEGHVPGAGVHPFPPPTAFAPGVPGDFGMAVNPNQGQSGFANPSYPAYPPPAYGFNENIAGGCLKHCHFFFLLTLFSVCHCHCRRRFP